MDRRQFLALTAAAADNTLTPEEKKAGWALLFDGKTFKNWQDPAKKVQPGDAWTIENGCFIFAPAMCGDHPGQRQTYGHSLVVDPWGKVLVDGGEAPGIAYADIDAEIERGKTTEVTFTPQVAGRFTAICDHFCGAGHGNMHMTFVVE